MEFVNCASLAHEIWTGCPRPYPQAKIRLFCFPYAGAGSSTFGTWARWLSPELELHLIHLPGRDKRIREPLPKNLTPLIESLGTALYSLLDRPFAFFGHSMGALISFEVACYLRRQYGLQPSHLFISAHHAPQLADRHAHLNQLPEPELLRVIQELYGELPDIVKTNPDVLQLFLSILRADLTMMGTYQYVPSAPFDCPISVFGGIQDKAVSEAELNPWCEHTTASFSKTMFPGNHFFIQSSRQTLLQHLTQKLI